MAYEVWLFEQQSEGPSKLVKVIDPPAELSFAAVSLWAGQIENDFAKEGLPITTVVRNERVY